MAAAATAPTSMSKADFFRDRRRADVVVVVVVVDGRNVDATSATLASGDVFVFCGC